MSKKFRRAKSAFASVGKTDDERRQNRLLAEGLMHLTDALSADSAGPAAAAPAAIDRSQIYDRLVGLIESRPGSHKVMNPYDLLIDDLGFDKQTLANFSARINGEFADLKVTISRKDIVNCKTVVDLANAIADAA